jgi:exodeoxyribonuclease VII large subunit
MDERRLRVEGLARGLPDPRSLLEHASQRLDDWADRLKNGLRQLVRHDARRLADLPARLKHGVARILDQRRMALETLGGRLESHRLSHANILARGYALARDAAGAVVTSARAALPGADLSLEFHDGKLAVRVAGAASGSKPPPAPKREQGKLL